MTPPIEYRSSVHPIEFRSIRSDADSDVIDDVTDALADLEGVDELLEDEGKRSYGVDHP